MEVSNEGTGQEFLNTKMSEKIQKIHGKCFIQ